jgi:predicted AAA+ superfamily ATPase
MKRLYEELLEEHLKEYRQMAFLSGPRQVGKTTSSKEASLESPSHYYFNWDNDRHRAWFIEGSEAIAAQAHLDEFSNIRPILVFDEIHKYRFWQRFLKGFFDLYEKKARIIVTGSARLDIYKKGGDSLMGRYFLYRIHPLSIREIIDPTIPDQEIRLPLEIAEEDYQALLKYGGFPEPYLKRSDLFWNRWKQLRLDQLFKEDIRDLTRIQELSQMRLLADLLCEQAAQLVVFSNLASKVKISHVTVKRWIDTLSSLYYCFCLQPWMKNVARSLIKEPKVFLWNWALIENQGARLENFVASHLLKAVHFWTDRGFGEYKLYFLRDKDQREVDFLVVKNKKPWFLVEVKTSGDRSISKALYHFQEQTGAPHAFQVSFELPYVDRDCFQEKGPILVPARTLLSQLI